MHKFDSNEAVVEWTHRKRKSSAARRGDARYGVDDATRLIKEIRGYRLRWE